MNNKFKQELQEREFSALKDCHRVILKWATGCGKSKMAIDLINYHIRQQKDPNIPWIDFHNILFVVAERAHIKNWKEEFNKWDLLMIRGLIQVTVVCYASLHKVKDKSFDIIVFDEAHHALSEKRMAALEEMKNNLSPDNYVYLLSAALPSSKLSSLEEIFGKFRVSTVSLKTAIREDILPDPKVYVVEMELDTVKANQEILTKGADKNSPKVSWEKRMKYIAKKTPCIIQCTERQKYADYSNTMEYWKEKYTITKNQFHHNLWVNAGSARKRFLGELKTEAVHNLLKKIPRDNRLVCFCASVNQAEIFSPSKNISSRRSSKQNQKIIDAFNERGINRIYAVGMITEGMNLADIQTGVIVQLDGKERLFIQKFGRVCRAESPVIYIFYYKDTQDEVYLRQALENISPEFVEYIKVKQLNTLLKSWTK